MKKHILLTLAVVPSAAMSQSFSLIGDLPGGSTHSAAYGTNNLGHVVGASMGTPNSHAVSWSLGGGISSLGYYGNGWDSSSANAISADGLTVVGTSTKAGSPPLNKAMVWKNGTFRTLSDTPGGNNTARANGVSGNGRVVVGYSENAGGGTGVKWALDENGNEVSREILQDFSGGFTTAQALDVSEDGQIAVGYGNVAGGQTAALWKNGVVQSLGTLTGGTIHSIANSISADGNWVVGRANGPLGFTAFRWSIDTGMLSLGDLPGGNFSSEAKAVSGDGSIIVGNGSPVGNSMVPFYWTEATGMMQLDTFLISKGLDLSSLGTNGKLINVLDISADGRYIVGQAQVGANNIGFVADTGAPVPEPATMAALGIGIAGILRRKRKK